MEHLSDDVGELVEFWTLLDEDRALLKGRRGATALGFALLLKHYSRHGRFPRGSAELPDAVVEFVARQVGVPGADLGSYEWSGSTIEYHRSQIRAHLGFRVATTNDQGKLTAWLVANVVLRWPGQVEGSARNPRDRNVLRAYPCRLRPGRERHLPYDVADDEAFFGRDRDIRLCHARGQHGEDLERTPPLVTPASAPAIDQHGSGPSVRRCRWAFGEFRRLSQRWAVRGQTVAVAGLRRG